MQNPEFIKNYYIGVPELGDCHTTVLGVRDPKITEPAGSPADYELYATISLRGISQTRLAQAMSAFYEIIQRQAYDKDVTIDTSLWYSRNYADDDSDSDEGNS